MDLAQHLRRQIAFSRATFGPGERRAMVIDHIRKELVEVASSPALPVDPIWLGPTEASLEWVDVVILAMDGLTRSLIASGLRHDTAADIAVMLIVEKQAENETRNWPDWRTVPADKAIQHLPHALGTCGQPQSDDTNEVAR